MSSTLIEKPTSWHQIWVEVRKIKDITRDMEDEVFGILARLSYEQVPFPTTVRGGIGAVHIIWRLPTATVNLTVLSHIYGVGVLYRATQYNARPRRIEYDMGDTVPALIYHVAHPDLVKP